MEEKIVGWMRWKRGGGVEEEVMGEEDKNGRIK